MAINSEELSKPLDRAHVTSRSQSGRTLSYIEGWHAIAEANRIFGFDGWTRETIEMREVRSPELVKSSKGVETWRVGFICKVRVTVDNVVREGTGYGSGALPDLGEAYESAVKEAETDAMKRALMTFGNPFGLALYDKTQANVATFEEPPAQPDQPTQLVKVSREAEKQMRLEVDACATADELKMLWNTKQFQAEFAKLGQTYKDGMIELFNERYAFLKETPAKLPPGYVPPSFEATQ
jgi:DNA recombination protein Rad52